MDLQAFMIGATFVLGLVVVTVGIVAMWKGRARSEGGSLKAAGISVEGKNGAALILLVGAAFVLSGFGWAATRTEAKTQEQIATSRTIDLKKASDAIEGYEKDKAKIREEIRTNLSQPDAAKLESKVPELRAQPRWVPTPALADHLRGLNPDRMRPVQ